MKMQNILSPSSPIFHRLGEHIQNIIEQVSVRLKYFLDTIHTIYESYGIKFQVKHNYTNLMRIITPFQLLSRFHVIDNGELLHPELIVKMMEDMENEEAYGNLRQLDESLDKPDEYEDSNKFVGLSKNSDRMQNEYKNAGKNNLGNTALEISKKMKEQIRQAQEEKRQRRQNQQQQKKEFQKFSKQQRQIKGHRQKQQKTNPEQFGYSQFSLVETTKKDSSTSYRKKGIIGKKRQNLSIIKPNADHFMREKVYYDAGRNYLSEELEIELCEWAINQMNSGKVLYTRDIMGQAKYLGRFIPNLSVCYGWFQRFMNKYPKLQILFRKSRGYMRHNTFDEQANIFSPALQNYHKPQLNPKQTKRSTTIYEEDQFEENKESNQMDSDVMENEQEYEESSLSRRRTQKSGKDKSIERGQISLGGSEKKKQRSEKSNSLGQKSATNKPRQ